MWRRRVQCAVRLVLVGAVSLAAAGCGDDEDASEPAAAVGVHLTSAMGGRSFPSRWFVWGETAPDVYGLFTSSNGRRFVPAELAVPDASMNVRLITAIERSADGFVAVGDVGTTRDYGTVWRSNDGVHWDIVAWGDEYFPPIESETARLPGIAARGIDWTVARFALHGTRSVVWSPDAGHTWSADATSPEGFLPTGLVPIAGRLLLVGGTNDGDRVYVRGRAAGWEPVRDPDILPGSFPAQNMVPVTVRLGQQALLGATVYDAASAKNHLGVFTSRDGVRWSEPAYLPGTKAGRLEFPSGGVYLFAGRTFAFATSAPGTDIPADQLRSWVSRDGHSWSEFGPALPGTGSGTWLQVGDSALLFARRDTDAQMKMWTVPLP